MPRKNKKTKQRPARKIVKKIKKVSAKSKVKKTARIKPDDLIGSVTAKPEVLGTKIPVVEIKSEIKPIAAIDAVETPADKIIINEINDFLIENNQPTQQLYRTESQPQNQESAEEYYQQKELSPRQKNIIMYASLTAIMSVLVFFWGLSIKNSLSQSFVPASNLGVEGGDIINEFESFFSNLQEDFETIKNSNQNINAKGVLDNIKQQAINNMVKDNITNQLKEKLENINTNNININNSSQIPKY